MVALFRVWFAWHWTVYPWVWRSQLFHCPKESEIKQGMHAAVLIESQWTYKYFNDTLNSFFVTSAPLSFCQVRDSLQNCDRDDTVRLFFPPDTQRASQGKWVLKKFVWINKSKKQERESKETLIKSKEWVSKVCCLFYEYMCFSSKKINSYKNIWTM